MKSLIEYIKKNSLNYDLIIGIILLLFFFSEAYNKVAFHIGWVENDIQKYLKFVTLLFLGIGLLFKDFKNFLGVVLLSLTFIVGQINLTDSFNYSSCIIASKYLFPVILFLFFNTLKIQCLKITGKIYESLILFNNILIIIGMFFEVKYFSTYRGDRFGYSGLLITSATSTYFYLIALSYFLIKYKSKLLKSYLFWTTVCASFFIGTKSIYLFLIILPVFYFYNYVDSKKIKYFFYSGFFGLSVTLLVYLLYFNETFSAIRNSHSIFTSILSYRDVLLTEKTLPFIQENWSFVNYLFGGVSDFETRPQLELVDLFYFWGVLGALIYGFIYFKSYFTLSAKNREFLFFIIALIPITFLAGNFFYNASLPIYLLVFREIAIQKQSNATFNYFPST